MGSCGQRSAAPRPGCHRRSLVNPQPAAASGPAELLRISANDLEVKASISYCPSQASRACTFICVETEENIPWTSSAQRERKKSLEKANKL